MQPQEVEELLAYFQQAIEHPESVRPWSVWWCANSEKARTALGREDYLRLKHRMLHGARVILERSGWWPEEPAQLQPIHTGFCDKCGERLFRMLPGVTREEVVEFGKRAGIEQCQQGYWLHPGLYCPNHCTWLLMELRQDTSADTADALRRPNGSERGDARDRR